MDRTNAERQRRHRARLKASATQARAQDIIGLRQENFALRGQVRALKQELAQLRGTPKPRKRRAAGTPNGKIKGLGLEALQAATTKANEALRPAHWPTIPPWVPGPARQSIQEARGLPFLNDDARAALNRLTIDGRMRTKVWEKLPPGVVEIIIPLAIHTLDVFPWRHQKLEWENWVRLAIRLRNVVAILRELAVPTADEIWSRHWPGDPAMKISAAITFLDALAHCLQSFGAKYQAMHDELPPIPRPNDPEAPWRYFGQYMSNELKKLCGSPYDHVVSELIGVVYETDPPGSDKVYSWRRMQAEK